MLIESRKYVQRTEGNPRDLVLEGQKSNYGNLAMCKMNLSYIMVQTLKLNMETY
jgi:type I restriction-modification system DNA methylase subunit